jgi:hypothetical protein
VGNGQGRYAAQTPGLTVLQQKMVAEAAEAFARQLAGHPDPSPSAAQEPAAKQQQREVSAPLGTAVVRQPSLARAPPMYVPVQNSANGQGQQQSGVKRAEDVLLAVAGCTNGTDLEGLTEAEFVAATKKKGPSCFRCRKVGHFLNDCEAVLCECCQRPEHASKDCPLLRAPRPRLAMYGMGHPDLAFWELPLSASVRPRVENTRLGRVEVSGGELSG